MKLEYSFVVSFILLFAISIPIGNTYEDVRIYRIPIAYFILIIPYISYLIFYLIFLKKNLKYPKTFFYLILYILIYIIILWLIHLNTFVPTIQYILMWLINLTSLLIFLKIYQHRDILPFLKGAKYLIFIISSAIIIGLIKMIFYHLPYANPFVILNRNLVGFILVFSLFMVITLFRLKIISKFLFIINTSIITIGIILLQSRAALLGSITGLLLMTFFSSRQKIILNIYFIIPILILTYLYSPFKERLDKAVNLALQLTNFIISGFDNEQIPIGEALRYQATIQGFLILKHYLILGTGPGIYNYLEAIKEEGYPILLTPHNFYLYIASQLGVIGLFSFVSLFIYILKKFNLIKDSIMKSFFISTYISFLIIAFFHDYLTFPLIWFLIGIGLGFSIKNYNTNCR